MSQAEDEPTDSETNVLFPFGCSVSDSLQLSDATQSQENDEPTGGSKKNEFFPFSCSVSELVLAHANLKQVQKKHSGGKAFMDSHASLFHAVHSVIKLFRNTAECAKDILLEAKQLDHTCISVPQKVDVVNEITDSTKNAQYNKDACALVHSKKASTLVHSKYPYLGKSKSTHVSLQKKYSLGELPSARLLPYLVLIKNCINLSFPIIQRKCLTGEILCRIQYFTLKHRKKKLPPEREPAKLPIPTTKGWHRKKKLPPEHEPAKLPIPTTKEAKYVTFESLRDLQWKIYRGLLKRKPKTTGTWREVTCLKNEAVLIPQFEEYILPLIPKDWIIDDSLKFTEKMAHFLLQNNSHC